MKFVPLVALLFSVAALAVALMDRGSASNSLASNDSEAALRKEVQELRERLAALEGSGLASSEGASASGNIERQMQALESSQLEIAELALGIDSLGVLETQERELIDAYKVLLDESRPAGERVKRAGLLKRYGQFDERAVESMWNLFSEAKKPYDQAAALTALKGHVSVERRDDVIAALNTDFEDGYKNGRLRYFGIEALEPLLPDPAVQEQLAHIAQNDPEPKIAARAARAAGLPMPDKQRPKGSRKQSSAR